MVVDLDAEVGAPRGGAAAAERRTARPVLWWAALGVIALALQAYVYARWVTSSDFRPVPTGKDPVPADLKMKAILLQVAFGVSAAATTAWVAAGCIRRRTLTFDAKLFLAFLAIIWMDHAANFVRPQMFMNSYYVNRGSWDEFIPGWISRNPGDLPASFFVEFAAYFCLATVVALGCNLLTRLRRRCPRMGNVGLALCAWLSMAVFVFVTETGIVHRLGWNTHAGAPPALTLFAGKLYAQPLTEIVVWSATLAAAVILRFQHVTTGASVVERGITRVKGSTYSRAAIVLLAVIGYITVAQGVYAVSTAAAGLYGGRVSDRMPSYFSNGICGDDAGIACPGPDVPVLLPKTPVDTSNKPRNDASG